MEIEKNDKENEDFTNSSKVNLTQFLKKNEIWFTTIASIFLGIMALTLSYNSYKLSKRQALIEYTNYHPDFQVSKNTWSSNNNEVKDNIEIVINNSNKGIARNIEISTISFLKIETSKRVYKRGETLDKLEPKINKLFLMDKFSDISYPNKENNYSIKLRDHDIKHMIHHDTIKYLATQEQKLLFFEKILNKKLKKNNFVTSLKTELYIKIEFDNFINERVSNYYKVNIGNIKHESFKEQESNDITVLDTNNGEKIFNTRERLNYISFVKINSFHVFDKKLNESNKYFYNEIDYLRFKEMHPKINDRKTDSINEKKVSQKFDSIFRRYLRKTDSISYITLIKEMEKNKLTEQEIKDLKETLYIE